MRRVIVAIGLECYALIFAFSQATLGVRTDEAKYLLNIPYPHPPLVRFLMSLTSAWSFQEILWRIIFATVLVQGVWLVWYLGRTLSFSRRIVLAALWLTSYPLIVLCGTVMMAPLTALQGLVLVAALSAVSAKASRSPLFWWGIGLFWLLSLFTAYQAVLYLPLMFAIYRRSPLSTWERSFVIIAPLVLLSLYTLTNPLVLASFILVGSQHAPTVTGRIGQAFLGWVFGGSIILGSVAMYGMAARRSWALLASTALVIAALFFSYHDYYAVLLMPLFIVAMADVLPSFSLRSGWILFGVTMAVTILLMPFPLASRTRHDMSFINELPREGNILIAGSFGHEWQYESSGPVLRFREDLLPSAKAVVCLAACPSMQKQSDWTRVRETDAETWVRDWRQSP